MSFPKKQHQQLLAVVENYQHKTNCAAAVFADLSGIPIGYAGTLNQEAVTLLTALAAGNYSATQELSKLIGESSFATNFLEGTKRSMYFAAVDDGYFIFILFNNSVTFGMIRLLTYKLISEIRTILQSINDSKEVEMFQQPEKAAISSEDFERELSAQLDSVLGINKTT